MRHGLLADAKDIYSSVKRLVAISGMDSAGNVTLSDLLRGDSFWLDLHDEEEEDARLTFTIGWDEEHAGIEISCDSDDICPSSMTAHEAMEQIAFLLAEYVSEITTGAPTVAEVKSELRRIQAAGPAYTTEALEALVADVLR